MRFFEFSKEIIEKIIDVLNDAEEFILLAIFQIHRKDIFEKLIEKSKEGISVEIFTLPSDSIHENREEIESLFEKLEKSNGKIHYCKWNVGDPGRTTTAVGRWYSFHGKFIVTDKAAISMTANLTLEPEYDAILIFKDEDDIIELYKNKFEKLKELFVIKHGGYNGTIRQKIMETKIENVDSVFGLPENIDEIYKDHWILHYPALLCPDEGTLKNFLYVIPFEGKGRHLLEKIITQSEEFVYIVSESFTDPSFPIFLNKTSFRNLDIKILCGAKSMDFTDRIQKTFRELLSQNIEIRTIGDDLHAKLVITDKLLVLTSINLNRISLGFRTRKNYWRENTETITVLDDKILINKATQQFNDIFEVASDIRGKLSEKIQKSMGNFIRSIFNIRSIKSEVKEEISRLILKKEIGINKYKYTLGKYLAIVANQLEKSQLNIEHFYLAIILNFLHENRLNYEELNNEIDKLDLNFNLKQKLTQLIEMRLIKKLNDKYFITNKNNL